MEFRASEVTEMRLSFLRAAELSGSPGPRRLYAVRITIVSLVGLLVASCAEPKQAAQPGAESGPASAPVAGTPPPKGPATAVSHESLPDSATAHDAPAIAPMPEEDAAPLPEGFVAISHPFHDGRDASRSALCGRLRVENVRGNPEVYEPFVVVTDTTTGKKIYEAHGRKYDPGGGQPMRMELTASVCGDVTGDGIAELLLTERTMGAHCCYTHYVTSMTSPTKLIMTWEKGDSGDGIWPVKLKPGPAWQIQSSELVWPPFDVEEGDPLLAYAFVPGFPIVFDLIGGRYQKRTFAFLSELKKEDDRARQACAKRPDCERNDLYEWGMAVMFDEWDAQKEKIVPEDMELRKRLDLRAVEMKKKMRAQLGG